MYRQRVDFRLDGGLVARVDVEAGRLGQTRTRFVERALEQALADREVVESQGSPASTRSPEDPMGVNEAVLREKLAAHLRPGEVIAPERRATASRLSKHAATCRCAVCSPPKS